MRIQSRSIRVLGAIALLASPLNAFGIGIGIGTPSSNSTWNADVTCKATGDHSQNPRDSPYSIKVFFQAPDGSTTANEDATLTSDTVWDCSIKLAARNPKVGTPNGQLPPAYKFSIEAFQNGHPLLDPTTNLAIEAHETVYLSNG